MYGNFFLLLWEFCSQIVFNAVFSCVPLIFLVNAGSIWIYVFK